MNSERSRRRRKRKYVESCMKSVACSQAFDVCSSPLLPVEECHANEIDFFEINYVENKTSSEPSDEECDAELTFCEEIRTWALSENVTQQALSTLLPILRKYLPTENIPLAPRTLFRSVGEKVSVVRIGRGQYCYFGVQHALEQRVKSGLKICKLPNLPSFSGFNASKILTITVGIDGLPISRSSRKQFWPILIKVDQSVNVTPAVVALWFGEEKPSAQYFLDPFISECKLLEESGVSIEGILYDFRISCVVADAPARSFLKCIVSHNGHFGCERCNQRGVWKQRLLFKRLDAEVRTDRSFLAQSQPGHHRGTSPFVELNIGLISQFSVDYMHLCLLGVMRRLLRIWLKGGVPYKLCSKDCKQISDMIVFLSEFIPDDFVRKGRSTNELDNWKATELRLFLLYTGPLVLRRVLSPSKYSHFLLFSLAIYILLLPEKSAEWVGVADNLLRQFVSLVPVLYDEKFMVYNIHSLIHLPDDSRVYNSLETVSAFDFENFMQTLKRLLRGRNFYMEQMVNRVTEMEDYRNGVLTRNSVHNNAGVNFLKLTREGNNCVLTTTGAIFLLETFVNSRFYGRQFLCKQKCDGYAVDSRLLEICMVSKLSSHVTALEPSDIARKCVCLPENSDNVRFMCIPLIHAFKFD